VRAAVVSQREIFYNTHTVTSINGANCVMVIKGMPFSCINITESNKADFEQMPGQALANHCF
jgi:hypothetical protein